MRYSRVFITFVSNISLKENKMKRICLSICLFISLMTGWAQVEARYDKGNVEVVNGRVMFQETVATTLDQAAAFERISQWAEQRFSKPNVIVSKFTSDDTTNHSLSLTAEHTEYLLGIVGTVKLRKDVFSLPWLLRLAYICHLVNTEMSDSRCLSVI